MDSRLLSPMGQFQKVYKLGLSRYSSKCLLCGGACRQFWTGLFCVSRLKGEKTAWQYVKDVALELCVVAAVILAILQLTHN